MATPFTTFLPPYRDVVLNNNGRLSYAWEYFIRNVFDRLSVLGVERSFDIANNQSSAADITGLSFNAKQVSAAFVEYLVHRVTTGAGATELTEVGLLIFAYNPTSENWDLVTVSEHNPDNAGIVFTITSAGQVQYTSTNISGTASISKLYWRARTLAGKHNTYSSVAVR